MKNTRKKMLLSSVAMLLVALVALGSATYAWFTINKTVFAQNISVEAAVADGLVITNAAAPGNNDWKRSVSFNKADDSSPLTYDVLQPVSINVPATDGGATALMGTPYAPNDVSDDGALNNGSAKGFSAKTLAALPVSGTLKTTNDYTAAYGFTVASSGDAISGDVTAKIEATGNGDNFAKAALVKGGKVIGFFTDGTYTAITGAGDTPTTATTAAAKVSDISAYTATVPVKADADTFTLYVWYEGNDGDCVDDPGQGAQTNFTVTFELS